MTAGTHDPTATRRVVSSTAWGADASWLTTGPPPKISANAPPTNPAGQMALSWALGYGYVAYNMHVHCPSHHKNRAQCYEICTHVPILCTRSAPSIERRPLTISGICFQPTSCLKAGSSMYFASFSLYTLLHGTTAWILVERLTRNAFLGQERRNMHTGLLAGEKCKRCDHAHGNRAHQSSSLNSVESKKLRTG